MMVVLIAELYRRLTQGFDHGFRMLIRVCQSYRATGAICWKMKLWT
jgi:hypothetical protein